MFLRKSLRKANKEISQNKDFVVSSDGDAIINVKVVNKDQIFSTYNYDNNEKLNSELSQFIYDKARFVQPAKNVKIKIFSTEEVDESEVSSAIKNHYKVDCIETKSEMRRNLLFSGIMLWLGIFFFAFLLLMHSYFYNAYLEIITEIATWVFIWEAVDSFFLERLKLKRKRNLLLKLYSAEIKVIVLDGKEVRNTKTPHS